MGIFKQTNPEFKKVHKYTVASFMLLFKPNNQPISIVANATYLMLSFYIRCINWSLTKEEPPTRQHSPPIVASPPRRKKYKPETSSTESAANASSSQHLEVERTYMSSDTSTRLVKKKKMGTKALVKRLLSVVADLSSKVDRILQKKDEPDTGFGEEDDMRGNLGVHLRMLSR
uniref:Uncharacterized protein n=1 Tax=Lactuca sativa TaxID=4236 RepID=A0A9R1UW75_LACSA|nr:hypothetical protein LSAT_V11C700357410 [Lactuca sativa]